MNQYEKLQVAYQYAAKGQFNFLRKLFRSFRVIFLLSIILILHDILTLWGKACLIKGENVNKPNQFILTHSHLDGPDDSNITIIGLSDNRAASEYDL